MLFGFKSSRQAFGLLQRLEQKVDHLMSITSDLLAAVAAEKNETLAARLAIGGLLAQIQALNDKVSSGSAIDVASVQDAINQLAADAQATALAIPADGVAKPPQVPTTLSGAPENKTIPGTTEPTAEGGSVAAVTGAPVNSNQGPDTVAGMSGSDNASSLTADHVAAIASQTNADPAVVQAAAVAHGEATAQGADPVVAAEAAAIDAGAPSQAAAANVAQAVDSAAKPS